MQIIPVFDNLSRPQKASIKPPKMSIENPPTT